MLTFWMLKDGGLERFQHALKVHLNAQGDNLTKKAQLKYSFIQMGGVLRLLSDGTNNKDHANLSLQSPDHRTKR